MASSRACSSVWLTLPSPSLSTLPNRSSPAWPVAALLLSPLRDWANAMVEGGGGSTFCIVLPSSSALRLPSPLASYCLTRSAALVWLLTPVFLATSSSRPCSSVSLTPPLPSASILDSSRSGEGGGRDARCTLAPDQALLTLLMVVIVVPFFQGGSVPGPPQRKPSAMARVHSWAGMSPGFVCFVPRPVQRAPARPEQGGECPPDCPEGAGVAA